MNLSLALGGERSRCFLLPAPECNSVQWQLLFWYFGSNSEKEAVDLSAEGLLYTLLLKFPLRYYRNLRDLCH